MKTYGSKVLSTVMCFLSIGLSLSVNLPANATPVVLTNMPAYAYFNGCVPTSTAMLFGYWSLHNYTNLFTAQGSNLYLTANVQDQISSPAHIANPSNESLPYTSIASFLKTSEIGETMSANIIPGITNYAKYRDYIFTASSPPGRLNTALILTNNWTTFTNEIHMGRPMLFIIDSNADTKADHAVPAFGYDNRGAEGWFYAHYSARGDGEEEITSWSKFQLMGNSNGIDKTIIIIPPAIKIPATISISPPSTNTGAAAFTLTINGSNFVSNSIVNFNGLAKTTTFVNPTKLTIPITVNDLLTAGTYSISVGNPGLCGGTSNPQTFTINKKLTGTMVRVF